MEPDLDFFTTLFPCLSAQLRMSLQNLQLASTRLAPPQQREQDPELDRAAAQADQSYYRMLRLANSLTAAAWLGREKPLRLSNVDLAALVQEVFASAESLGALKGLTMHLRCPCDRHLCAADRDGLRQALYQLLSNAFKFTPEGGEITVEMKLVPGFVQLSVADTGPGMTAEQLDRIFRRRLCPETLIPQPGQGIGLGLLLCRAIVQAHGGSLLADAAPGRGSRFVLTLPDRMTRTVQLGDVTVEDAGGFNDALMQLSDALPTEAFRIRCQ